MIEIVNKVFTFITHLDDLVILRDSGRWDRPELDSNLFKFAQRQSTTRSDEEG
ncbi:hypothetical protein [Sphingomonas sp. AP4-R1]|uniref:hypothetical protein n=1 Tax=Sphingomonas sp. AP4-R1 TaxID=2735134 RepID=UPI0020A538A5|nr:hypothetical protein [Sphingomonas sp. AP4-R1]